MPNPIGGDAPVLGVLPHEPHRLSPILLAEGPYLDDQRAVGRLVVGMCRAAQPGVQAVAELEQVRVCIRRAAEPVFEDEGRDPLPVSQRAMS